MPVLRRIAIEFWRDTSGQDMIEYALMAAVVAVAVAVILPPLAPAISTVFSKIQSVMNATP